MHRAMKTDTNNRDTSGDRREPGDVYMMFSPEGKIQAVAANDRFYKNFGHFIDTCAYHMLTGWVPPCPNSFFVHYHFTDPDSTWGPYENTSMFSRKLLSTIKAQRLKPLNTCRLYPAMYCVQHRLDPLLPENSGAALSKSIDYQSAVLRYSCFGERTEEKNYIGIETDRGMLLFDNTERGEQLQKLYKDFFVNNFFDPRLDNITFLKTIELIPTETQKAKINPDITPDMLYNTERELFGVVSADRYLNLKKIGIYDIVEHYDMTATLANFTAISRHGKDELPSLTDDTYNIGCLLHLASPECKTPDIEDELPNLFYYGNHFNPLSERFAEAATEGEKAQIMASVRELAGHLLKRDFPNIRRPRAAIPERKKQFGVAGATTERPARQLPDVAKKLATHSKKKTGLKP